MKAETTLGKLLNNRRNVICILNVISFIFQLIFIARTKFCRFSAQLFIKIKSFLYKLNAKTDSTQKFCKSVVRKIYKYR